VATDILITVIVYNTPPRVSYSALALACRWVQNQLFDSDTRFLMAAKRQVRYTCTIRLVRDRKFGDWIKPLRVRWSSFISAFFVVVVFWTPWGHWGNRWVYWFAVTSHRQREVRLLLLVAGALLACVLLYFFRAFFILFLLFLFYSFLHFMVYSVETVTEAFWAFFFSFYIFFFRFHPVSFAVLRKFWRLIFLNFYFTMIINQCK